MRLHLFSILIGTFLLSGCSSTTAPESSDADALRGRTWVLLRIDGKTIQERLTLDFYSDTVFGGISAANRYWGSFVALNPALDFDDAIGMTKRLGTDFEMVLEDRYINSLRRVERYRVNGDVLELAYGMRGFAATGGSLEYRAAVESDSLPAD